MSRLSGKATGGPLTFAVTLDENVALRLMGGGNGLTGRVTPFWRTLIIILTVAVILLSINQLFYLRAFGFNPIVEAYLFYLLACLLPITFIVFPLRKQEKQAPVAWYDVILGAVAFVIPLYMGINAHRMVLEGWDRVAPALPTAASIVLWVILLEGVRRAADSVLMWFCLAFSLFPMFTGYMPIRVLQGIEYTFIETARSHIMSLNSVLGAPLTTMGTLLIGFMIFGVILVNTGGGDFFFNMAQALFGRTRGGAAKVSVVGSAFFGMLSGSAISNVVTTGTLTIPAMKRSGYSSEYSAAIEATASTGGTITPPIMGSAAFIMASFLAVPYVDIAKAAAIPAFLYFLSLFIQVDSHAALLNLKGEKSENLPRILDTLKQGWIYIFALVAMIYLLVVTYNEAQAPYYASVLLIMASFLSPRTRLTFKKAMDMLFDCGKILAEITAMLAAVGFIVGALSNTGVSFSFSRELVAAAGDNILLILIAGAITSFVLGMGMTISASYIFLALVMGPALIRLGIHPIAAHLFILFWAKVSYITPPVALATYAAAGIAGGNPVKSGLVSIRLGVVSYIVPFFMVYNTALIADGTLSEIAITLIFAILGVWWLASSLEGYLFGYGRLDNKIIRAIVAACGLLAFFPEVVTSLGATVVMLLLFAWSFFRRRPMVSAST